MPEASPSGAPTPSPAPEGGEVLSAGRARALAAKGRNQPQALERIGVSDALKGTLRRASPALDRVFNASNSAARGRRGPRLAAVASGQFHTKRHRPGPKPAAAHREPELLYSEIGKLKMELDWLKKKSGISLS
jgi:hypothetical protein